MKKSLVLIILIFNLIFVSCGGETIFAGRAYRLKAEAALKEVRNALAKYSIKNGYYPSGEEWERVLVPYFRKEINPDPEWITRRKMFVMRAKTKITQCEGIVKEIKKDLFYADSSLMQGITEYLYPILADIQQDLLATLYGCSDSESLLASPFATPTYALVICEKLEGIGSFSDSKDFIKKH